MTLIEGIIKEWEQRIRMLHRQRPYHSRELERIAHEIALAEDEIASLKQRQSKAMGDSNEST